MVVEAKMGMASIDSKLDYHRFKSNESGVNAMEVHSNFHDHHCIHGKAVKLVSLSGLWPYRLTIVNVFCACDAAPQRLHS